MIATEKATPEAIDEYLTTFVQPIPYFAVRQVQKDKWHKIGKTMTRNCVRRHLVGEKIYGCVARWYPSHSEYDIDNWEQSRVEDFRAEIGMDENNSMLFEGEKRDHWRILYKPTYRGEPVTIKLLQSAMKKVGDQFGVEVYPQSKRISRLPFSHTYTPRDYDRWLLDSKGLVNEFQKLNEYDITNDCPIRATEPFQQPLLWTEDSRKEGWYQEGKELYEAGLVVPNSRHLSQMKVIYFLWRNNTPNEMAEDLTKKWIQRKNNELSYDFRVNRRKVYQEIKSQVEWIYSSFMQDKYYPDSTHNNFEGWITKPDLLEIVKITQGNLPRTRFLTQMIQFANPRQVQPFVRIHTSRLQQWSSTTNYLSYIDELESKGIVQRKKGRTGYLVNNFSKSLSLKWDYETITRSIMNDGRTPDSYEEIIQTAFEPRDYKSLLQSVGVERTTAIKQVKTIYRV